MSIDGGGVAFFKCPQCGMQSYNPNDIVNLYCGNCHKFIGDEEIVMSTKITAPWTKAQVDALNKWQKLGYVHEFWCPEDASHDEAGRILIATRHGWRCAFCGYSQDWAYDFMCDEALHPKPPFGG